MNYRILFVFITSLALTSCGGGGLILGDPDGQQINLGAIFGGAKKAFGKVDEKEELEIGKQGAAVLLGAVKLEKNPKLQAYVNKVGQWVVQQTSAKKNKIHATASVNFF